MGRLLKWTINSRSPSGSALAIRKRCSWLRGMHAKRRVSSEDSFDGLERTPLKTKVQSPKSKVLMSFGHERDLKRVRLKSGHVQEVRRVTRADRSKIQLAVQANKFRRKRWERAEDARRGPGRCRHCGAGPCGAGWGPVRDDESALCCEKCDHVATPGWRPTHVLWYGKKPFFVSEVAFGRGGGQGAVYFRQDGVVEFVRIGMEHYFLGQLLQHPDFARFKATDPNGMPAGVTVASVFAAVGAEPEGVEDDTEGWDEEHDEEAGGDAEGPGDDYDETFGTDIEGQEPEDIETEGSGDEDEDGEEDEDQGDDDEDEDDE